MSELFKKLGIGEAILKAIDDEGFTEPTEVQEKTIPLTLAGRDVIAGSSTGSGKTLAFSCGMINTVTPGAGIQALIMCPTRELAEQVAQNIKTFSKYRKLKIAIVYGGVAIEPQMKALTKADIVVGTPGRILDHLQRKTIDLSKVKTLVLDEADRMLDMGFVEDVERIMSQIPKDRQTLFFSATLSQEITGLANKYMNNAEKIVVDPYVDPSLLKQIYYDVDDKLKFSLLVHLLKGEHAGTVMIFCNSKRNCTFLEKNLQHHKIDATAIHGGLTQAKRSKIMEKFQSQKVTILICTDVAARGLHVPHVTHVYNYDIPNDSRQYVHRIGRTARAGAEGMAINILGGRDHDNFRRVLRDNDVHVDKEETPYVERASIVWKGDARGGPRRGPPRHGGGGRRGPPRHGSRGRRPRRN